MSNQIKENITIPPEFSGKRFDQTLAALLPSFSRMQIQTWINTGDAKLDGKVVKPKVKVKGGEVVQVYTKLEEKGDWEAQDIPLDIVHEDESILIINKSSNFVVHPGAGNPNKTLLNALLHYLPSLRLLPRAGIVHRIDKDTTGLLIIAKTQPALTMLQRMLKAHTINREYQAIVQGRIISGATIDAPIARHPTQRTRMAVVQSGKPAITTYRVLEKFRSHTLLRLRLGTGRTHQIRVHMCSIKHPIIGDPLYGGRLFLAKNMSDQTIQTLRQLKRQALHAFALSFNHPISQKPLHFEIDLPEDMLTLIRVLRMDAKENE